MIIILVLAFGAMWLMTSRTRKQQREAADFRANLEAGQEVMTGSGLYGTIVDVEGDVITLESTPGSRTRWIRAAIAKVVPPAEEVVEDDDAADASLAVQDFGTSPRVDRIDVPDDLSAMNERRTDDGTNPR